MACASALVAYSLGAVQYRRVRGRRWPAARSLWFGVGAASALIAIESPLDAAGDSRFAPHMVQHLILTDISAPCILLGGPLLLLLSVGPNRVARAVVLFLNGRVGRALTCPALTWSIFIVTLWTLHYSGFFELALESESVHVLEHAIFLAAALLFWLPIVGVGPTPWAGNVLAHPMRMVYLLVAMPAEAMLGFTLNGARHILYRHYAGAGLADQQAAGEIMWIGGSLCMFVAFMLVGLDWAKHEQRLGERADQLA